MEEKKGAIIAVSAPSGAGKTTIVKKILEEIPGLVFSISATTRKKRDYEVDGVDYFFISKEEFLKKIKNSEFVEWEQFYGYYYGTFKSFVDDNINNGKSVLLEVDVKGALSIKNIYSTAYLIFIVPPSFDELVSRLKNRKTEDEVELERRVERAKMELKLKDNFDYLITNDVLEKAISETKNLILKILNKENI